MKKKTPAFLSLGIPEWAFFLLLILLVPLAGCSVNQYGIPGTVQKEERQNRCGRTVVLTAYGIHLYTDPNPGLQIGMRRIEMTYAQISPSSQFPNCNTFLSPRSSPYDCRTGSPEPSNPINYASTPVHTDAENAGLGLDLSTYALTLSLGLNRKRMLEIGPNQDFIFCYESGNLSRTSGAVSP